MINPFVLGAIRERQIQEAFRRNTIRMDLAGNTGFLNPELYTAYLNGAANPNAPAVSPEILSIMFNQANTIQAPATPPEFFINPALPLPVTDQRELEVRQILAALAERRLNGGYI